MPVEICTVGGYDEVGRNCTAVKIDDEVIIFDMGVYLENYIRFTQDEDIIGVHKIKAIIPSHAHLDHIGGLPFLASQFGVPIIGTPYTISVIKAILKDEKIKLNNSLQVLNAGSKLQLTKNITVEFVNMTHSTPQTVMVALHTKYGVIVYANDFKFDLHPVLGKKADVERLAELGRHERVAGAGLIQKRKV